MQKKKIIICSRRSDSNRRRDSQNKSNFRSITMDSKLSYLLEMKQAVANFFNISTDIIIESSIICPKHIFALNRDKDFMLLYNQTYNQEIGHNAGVNELHVPSDNNILVSDTFDDNFNNNVMDEDTDEQSSDEEYFYEEAQTETITLDLDRSKTSHRFCFVCNKTITDALTKMITKEVMADVFINKNIVIKKDSRCCLDHYKYLKEDAMDRIIVFDKSIALNKNEIQVISQHLN